MGEMCSLSSDKTSEVRLQSDFSDSQSQCISTLQTHSIVIVHVRLTVHVDLDGGGHRVTDVVVAGLAGQDGVQVLTPEVVEQQGVDGLVRLVVLVGAVYERVLPPPV